MAKSKIYALYDNDVLVGEYTTSGIAELTGANLKRVQRAASNGTKLDKRYYIEVVRDKDNRDEALLRDWDETRLKILARG